MYDRNVKASARQMAEMEMERTCVATEQPAMAAGASWGGGPLGVPVQSGRGEIATALESQEMAVAELQKVVHVLAEKLSPVLSPSPASDKNTGESRGYGSPIAGCVAQNTIGIKRAVDRLASLINDLAV